MVGTQARVQLGDPEGETVAGGDPTSLFRDFLVSGNYTPESSISGFTGCSGSVRSGETLNLRSSVYLRRFGYGS